MDKIIHVNEIETFNVSIDIFKLEMLQFKTHTNSNINVWKKIFIDGGETLKSAPATYYPQIYKHWTKKTINEKDLIFFHENQLAKFLYPLELIKNTGK